MMRSTINTWEDALADIICKKPLFYRLHMPSAGRGERHQPDPAQDESKRAKRAKPVEHYTMLVETDVVSSVHGILP